jgi:hypothetical protein
LSIKIKLFNHQSNLQNNKIDNFLNPKGSVLITSVIFITIVMALTLGYYRTVMGERINYLSRLAKIQAHYNAENGLGKNYGYIASGTFVDTVFGSSEIKEMSGGVLKVNFFDTTATNLRTNFIGNAIGYATYPGFDGKPIQVTDTAQIAYQPVGFEEYMYFSDRELPGGGPWLGATVKFGGTDDLEGKIFSNDVIQIGAGNGCPTFDENAEVGTAKVFNYNNGCNESGVFGSGDNEITHRDSMPEIEWPPFVGQDRVKSHATHTFTANQFILAPGSTDRDKLVMTDIQFFDDYYVVKQWKYVQPPYTSAFIFNAADRDSLKKDYPLKYAQMYNPNAYGPNVGGYDSYRDWPLFDVDNQAPANFLDYVTYQQIFSNEDVIWIEGGQVRVSGTVRGRFTIATSGPQLYRMHFDNATIDTLFTNIWLTDDLVYADSQTSGAVTEGSTNRMGLLSGANIIIANTFPNGKKNSAIASNIKINAAMIAMDESFVVQYWQNSTAGYYFLDGQFIKGDGRGGSAFNNTGTNDYRGNIIIYGSVIQSKRGYVKRNQTGPYNIMSGIGYDKDYNYDYNLRDYPPPSWPEMRTNDGSVNLTLASYGVN